MRDYYSLGSTPYEEDCASVGSDDYHKRARAECRAFIAQLERTFGTPPDGCRFVVRNCPHDFGSYLDVEVVFDGNDERAAEYAIRCENDAPARWDEQARIELGMEVTDEAA